MFANAKNLILCWAFVKKESVVPLTPIEEQDGYGSKNLSRTWETFQGSSEEVNRQAEKNLQLDRSRLQK
jgi:hypothetical protein